MLRTLVPVVLTCLLAAPALAADSHVRLNTVGFLPEAPARVYALAGCVEAKPRI